MYHLRLTKALSYIGAISATRENPDAYTDEEAIAMAAVASGYFELVDDGGAQEEAETGEVVTEPAYSGKTLDEMNNAELDTFATYRGVSLKGCRSRAAKVAKLIKELGEEITSGELEYGSPTIVELQEE